MRPNNLRRHRELDYDRSPRSKLDPAELRQISPRSRTRRERPGPQAAQLARGRERKEIAVSPGERAGALEARSSSPTPPRSTHAGLRPRAPNPPRRQGKSTILKNGSSFTPSSICSSRDFGAHRWSLRAGRASSGARRRATRAPASRGGGLAIEWRSRTRERWLRTVQIARDLRLCTRSEELEHRGPALL